MHPARSPSTDRTPGCMGSTLRDVRRQVVAKADAALVRVHGSHRGRGRTNLRPRAAWCIQAQAPWPCRTANHNGRQAPHVLGSIRRRDHDNTQKRARACCHAGSARRDVWLPRPGHVPRRHRMKVSAKRILTWLPASTTPTRSAPGGCGNERLGAARTSWGGSLSPPPPALNSGAG